MSRAISVEFLEEMSDVDVINHRRKNFAEVVWTWLNDNDLGTLNLKEVDKGWPTSFLISSVKASKLRRVCKWVEQEAERHSLRMKVVVPTDTRRSSEFGR